MDLKKESFEKNDLRNHAEGYMNRIRGFLDGLLNWFVTWNIALLGVAFIDLAKAPKNSLAASGFGFTLNIFVGIIYYYQRKVTKNLVSEGFLPDFSKGKLCSASYKGRTL